MTSCIGQSTRLWTPRSGRTATRQSSLSGTKAISSPPQAKKTPAAVVIQCPAEVIWLLWSFRTQSIHRSPPIWPLTTTRCLLRSRAAWDWAAWHSLVIPPMWSRCATWLTRTGKRSKKIGDPWVAIPSNIWHEMAVWRCHTAISCQIDKINE